MKLKPWRKSLMFKKHISTFLSEQVCFLFQLQASSLLPIHLATCIREVRGQEDIYSLYCSYHQTLQRNLESHDVTDPVTMCLWEFQ